VNKKATTIFLLSLWILQWIVPSLFRKMEIWACEEESKNYIQHSEKLSKTSQIFYGIHDKIDWNKPGKEIVYNGQHYDVISIIKSSNGCLVYCYQDTKEDLVIMYYKELIRQNKTSNNPYSKILKKIIDEQFISYEIVPSIKPTLIKNKIASNDIAPVGNAYQNLNYPPPEIA